jgi:hypothetical protein
MIWGLIWGVLGAKRERERIRKGGGVYGIRASTVGAPLLLRTK